MFKHIGMNLKIDPASKIPLHSQVEQLLRAMIARPEYRQGQFLPKEVDISNMLGISRNTVRHAIGKLVNEGLLVRKKGVGTKVVPKRMSTRLDSWISFSKEMKAKGVEVVNYELNASAVKADEEVADALHIAKRTRVIQLSRLRGTRQGPCLLSISWFHPRLNLTGEEDFSRPLYQMLEEDFGVILTISREEISAIAAEEALASKLVIGIGDPVLFRNRFVYDSNGRIVEFNKVFYQGDGFSYSIDINRP